jgi:hypothetical protein
MRPTQNGVKVKGVSTRLRLGTQGPEGEKGEMLINQSGGLDIKAVVS